MFVIKTSYRARSLRLAVHHDGRVVVTRPYFMSLRSAEKFLQEKSAWIKTQQERFKNTPSFLLAPVSKRDYQDKHDLAKQLITARLAYYSKLYGFKYQGLSIRNQRTRWGSCSKTGNLNFNYRLLELPERWRDYIIVHELCHLKEFNHSPRFWSLVAKTFPDHKEIRRGLKGRLF